ncbi:hypothetical protein BD310DRAFT_833189 [Dichomitus squalens]|uniref:Uncharacterized protein n=1 Tax=Dichomitus squalens TaxID=114155 RepID=A0A4Q9PB88_9APHY|nr:hypothetical protein BD310DRAFT_833189 [Dichomitus squalens]
MFREHFSDFEVKDLWGDFHAFCTEYRHLVPLALREALDAFYLARKAYGEAKKRIVRSCRLNHKAVTAADREAWLKEHCIIIEVQKCQKPYPPLQHWVVESGEIAELWHAHCVDGKLHDKRGKHYPLFRVDETELVVARADQSVLFVDKDSRELVAFVIRNWCPEAGIVDSVNAVVHNAAAYKKNVRLDDPGFMSHAGYTAGSRSQPGFDWARNLSPKLAKDSAFVRSMRYQESSICAFLWNMAKGTLPAEVIKSYDDFLHSHHMARMGCGDGDFRKVGEYMVKDSSVPPDAPYPSTFTFQAVERSPPSALFSVNYARRIHWEGSPHKWLFSWTLKRHYGPESGGNFYIPEHKIKIEGASNSCVGWWPGKPHGTSLRACGPQEQLATLYEVGLSFVTSSRLPKQWTCYTASNFNEKERDQIMKELGDQFDTDVEADV